MAKAGSTKTNALAVAGMILPLLIKEIDERILQPRRKAATPEAAADVVEQLRKLAELRDEHVITDAEFDAKKRQLLRRL